MYNFKCYWTWNLPCYNFHLILRDSVRTNFYGISYINFNFIYLRQSNLYQYQFQSFNYYRYIWYSKRDVYTIIYRCVAHITLFVELYSEISSLFTFRNLSRRNFIIYILTPFLRTLTLSSYDTDYPCFISQFIPQFDSHESRIR